jgi:hypothetical protein
VEERRPRPELDEVREAMREHDEREAEDAPPDREADEDPGKGEAAPAS